MSRLSPDYTVHLVQTLDDALDLKRWLGERRHGSHLGVDTETSGLNLGRDKIRLCQFGDLAEGWAVPWEDWKGVVKDVLPVYDRPIALHNAAFDVAMLKRDGVTMPELLVDDTMIAAHLVNPVSFIGLKPLAAKLVGPEAMMGKDDLSDAFHKSGWDWDSVPVDFPAYWIYGVMDTSLTVGIAEELLPEVHEKYQRAYEVEMGCLHVLVNARLRGMKVDLEYVNQTRGQLMSDMAQLRERIPIDPGKDRQVRDIIERTAQRGPLGSWWPFRTDSGEVSVDKDALGYFEPDFPDLIGPIKEWRQKAKIVGTYLNNILRENVDGVVRPSINQVAARTARMSITDPALQTLPRGTVVRDAFVAREGHKLLMADYAQAELRVFAYYANCVPMIEAFQRGDDLHRWVASGAYTEWDQDRVEKSQRQVAKNVQFAKLYGAGPPKIAATAGVSIEVVEDFLRRYNEIFPEVPVFQQRLMSELHRRKREEGQMYVETILGRRLIVDDDKPYVGVNYLVQSSATSDLIKLKICELDAAGMGDYIRLPVHDEIITEVPDEEVEYAREIVQRVMPERKLFGACPLEIDTDVVSRWGDHYR